jgi:hypothetical protein
MWVGVNASGSSRAPDGDPIYPDTDRIKSGYLSFSTSLMLLLSKQLLSTLCY